MLHRSRLLNFFSWASKLEFGCSRSCLVFAGRHLDTVPKCHSSGWESWQHSWISPGEIVLFVHAFSKLSAEAQSGPKELEHLSFSSRLAASVCHFSFQVIVLTFHSFWEVLSVIQWRQGLCYLDRVDWKCLLFIFVSFWATTFYRTYKILRRSCTCVCLELSFSWLVTFRRQLEFMQLALLWSVRHL